MNGRYTCFTKFVNTIWALESKFWCEKIKKRDLYLKMLLKCWSVQIWNLQEKACGVTALNCKTIEKVRHF